MKVYMVQFDWSTTDDEGIETELFDTYKKAYKCFTKVIRNERNPNLSWVGDEAFDKNGKVNEDYELEKRIATDDSEEINCWWHIVDKNDWNRHSFLDLKIMEVQ